MRRIALATAALLCSAGMALAGDQSVAEVTLDSMGLGRMQPLSDQEGMAVRGKGFLDFLGDFIPETGGSGNHSSGFSGDVRVPSNPLDKAKMTLDGKLHGPESTSGPSGIVPGNLFGLNNILDVFTSPLP